MPAGLRYVHLVANPVLEDLEGSILTFRPSEVKKAIGSKPHNSGCSRHKG